MTTKLETTVRSGKDLLVAAPHGEAVIPLEQITGPGAIETVLKQLSGDFRKMDPEPIKAVGRDVLIYDKKDPQLPSLATIATLLMFEPSGERMVEDIYISRRHHARCSDGSADRALDPKPGHDVLYVRMFSYAQREANEAMARFDDGILPAACSWRDLHIATLGVRLEDEQEHAVWFGNTYNGPKATPAKAAALRRKKQVPEGVAAFIMKVVERDYRDGSTVDVDELVSKVVPTIPVMKDKEGKNRTERNVRNAIRRLVELGILFLHGTQISLTKLEVTAE